MLTGGVMGLAIHDLPLVRRFAPDFRDVEVLHAQTVLPFGYVISLRAGAVTIELRAAMNGTWEPSWTFEAIGDDASLSIDFTPSYVHAGSATARIRTAAAPPSSAPSATTATRANGANSPSSPAAPERPPARRR